MAKLVFITHPEVLVDPDTDIRSWRLSDAGRVRMATFARDPVVANVTAVWSSDEAKAVEAAAILTGHLAVPHGLDGDLGENDRSATGYLPPSDFEATADRFFAEPNQSIRGWERAIDAQQRIRRAVATRLTTHGGGDIAIVAHGAVGTLLLCSCLRIPIDRAEDQPFQGHYWQADLPKMTVLHRWASISPTG